MEQVWHWLHELVALLCCDPHTERLIVYSLARFSELFALLCCSPHAAGLCVALPAVGWDNAEGSLLAVDRMWTG